PMVGLGEQGIINAGNELRRKTGYELLFLVSKISVLIFLGGHYSSKMSTHMIVYAGCPRLSGFNLSRTMIEGAPSFRGVCEKVGFDEVSLLLPGEPFAGHAGDVGNRARLGSVCRP